MTCWYLIEIINDRKIIIFWEARTSRKLELTLFGLVWLLEMFVTNFLRGALSRPIGNYSNIHKLARKRSQRFLLIQIAIDLIFPLISSAFAAAQSYFTRKSLVNYLALYSQLLPSNPSPSRQFMCRNLFSASISFYCRSAWAWLAEKLEVSREKHSFSILMRS